jgi:hypothetical protein
MKRFEKWRDPDADPTKATDIHSTDGTPIGARGEDLREFLSEVDGFEPEAEAYVYAVALVRRRTGTRWYYVGQTMNGEDGLEARFRKHIRGEMTKTVRRDGIDVLDSPLSEDTTDTYVATGVERVEPVSVEIEPLQDARVLERERKMAYEVAIDNETTNVLGGA